MTIAFVLACFTLTGTAHLQTDQPAISPTQPTVKLNVLVLDDSKQAVNDVNQNEFRVFENNVEQKISFFSKEPLPLSYGLLVDNSGSLRTQLNEVIETGKRIVNATRPEDEAFVMRFVSSEEIDILRDFTSDKTALDRSLNGLAPAGGQTALIDAVLVAAMHMSKGKKDDSNRSRRRVLFLISDGEDRESESKAETLFEFLRKSDIQIYVIGLVSALENDRGAPFGRKATRSKSVDLLNRLANETGGRAFFPTSAGQFSDAVNEIMRDLRTQYLIGYVPSANPENKAYRNLKVKIEREKGGEKRTIITRPGYVVSAK